MSTKLRSEATELSLFPLLEPCLLALSQAELQDLCLTIVSASFPGALIALIEGGDPEY